MTDLEMMKLCLRAFEAIPTADKSRKVLKQMGKVPMAYAGNRSHVLAAEMVKELRYHLGEEA